MNGAREHRLPLDRIPSPCYVVDTGLLQANLHKLGEVQHRSGARIILALKGFSMFGVFPQIRNVLHGTTASSLNEALLGHHEFGKEVHAYFVAYRDQEIDEVLGMAHHITFNSLSQWRKYRERVVNHPRHVSPALRINPEYSEVATLLYNPCRAGTRFGVRSDQITEADLEGLEGLHFHTMCEQNSDTLARTLEHVETRFGKWLGRMKWLNMGGGHHITRDDYDVNLLCECVQRIKEKYGLEVYMEPGEAVALNTGYLIARVVDVFSEESPRQVILDTSASAHMPDVLEMPYRPHIIGAGEPGEKQYNHVLGGLTCLAGDDIGMYSFEQPLVEGDALVFTDMAHYSMVKNTTFNGVPLPSIATYDPDTDHLTVIREFGYNDFRNRLS